jgi:co-chaperonin GroES (HSP10)
MYKPVNKRILIEILEEDNYKKSKSGLIVPNQGIMTTSGQSALPKTTLLVKDVAEDCTLDIKVGDKIHVESPRYIYFLGENDEKLTLIKEESVEAIERD